MSLAASTQLKPLIGEERSGRYKILILGNSGTGKTTLGARLSRLLNIPHISLDTLHWGPNWQACPANEFRAKVQAKLDNTAKTGWIIDGSYASKLGNLVKDNATDIICELTDLPGCLSLINQSLGLDPPFILYFTRICHRTFARLLGYGQPCSPGCDESWRNVFTFGEENILWWCWTHHNPYRQSQQTEMMSRVFGPKTRRLGGWGRETEDWIRDIREIVREI